MTSWSSWKAALVCTDKLRRVTQVFIYREVGDGNLEVMGPGGRNEVVGPDVTPPDGFSFTLSAEDPLSSGRKHDGVADDADHGDFG